MPRFFIEVPHDEEEQACIQAIRIFLETGSHWLVNADWGCSDGQHAAWIILEAESKQEAIQVVPPLFRPDARVVQLNKFTLDEINQMMESHQG